MKTLEGQCIGGPLDGKMMAHWAPRRVILRTAPIGREFPLTLDEGEYRWGQFGHWHWVQTLQKDAT